MKDRDNKLQSLRPELSLAPASSPIEQFQNNTLRPVLKLQNDLLLAIFRNQLIKRKGAFFQLSDTKKLDYIQHQIIQDKNFKNLLFGLVIGHFSEAEYHFYQNEEAECRKRMTSLLIQRIQSQHSLLTSEPV